VQIKAPGRVYVPPVEPPVADANQYLVIGLAVVAAAFQKKNDGASGP